MSGLSTNNELIISRWTESTDVLGRLWEPSTNQSAEVERLSAVGERDRDIEITHVR